MMHFVKDEKSSRQRGSKGEMLYLRLTDEQNLYSEVELCRSRRAEIRAVDHHSVLIYACSKYTRM